MIRVEDMDITKEKTVVSMMIIIVITGILILTILIIVMRMDAIVGISVAEGVHIQIGMTKERISLDHLVFRIHIERVQHILVMIVVMTIENNMLKESSDLVKMRDIQIQNLAQ